MFIFQIGLRTLCYPVLVIGFICPVVAAGAMNSALQTKPITRTRSQMLQAATRRIEPVWPPVAKAAKLRGGALVGVNVSESGDVESALILDGQSIFKKAALEAALQWKFKPLTMNGAHVKFRGALLLGFGEPARMSKEQAIALLRGEVEREPLSNFAHYNLGMAYYTAGLDREAVEEFKKSISLDPEFALAHQSLGVSLLMETRFREALDAAKEAIRLKPDLIEAYYDLATAYEYVRQNELAIAVYTGLLDERQDLGIAERAYAWLAVKYEFLGRTEEAIQAYEGLIDADNQCASYDPGTPRSTELSARILGQLYQKVGRNEEAIKAFRWIVDSTRNLGNLIDAYLRIASVYEQGGSKVEAAKVYSEALNRAKQALNGARGSDQAGAAHYNVALVFDAMGQRKEALAEYRKAVDLEPNWSQPHVRLAQLYKKLGDDQSSSKEYLIVKRLDAQAARELSNILDILKKTETPH